MKKGKRQWYKEVPRNGGREDYYFLLEWIDGVKWRALVVVHQGRAIHAYDDEVYDFNPEAKYYAKCEASEAIAHLL